MMRVDDPEFQKRYQAYNEGLADFSDAEKDDALLECLAFAGPSDLVASIWIPADVKSAPLFELYEELSRFSRNGRKSIESKVRAIKANGLSKRALRFLEPLSKQTSRSVQENKSEGLANSIIFRQTLGLVLILHSIKSLGGSPNTWHQLQELRQHTDPRIAKEANTDL